MHIAFAMAPIVGAAGVIAWRVRETRRPLTARAIVMPPLGMSTGLLMFAWPAARVPWSWAALALLSGAVLLSYPLARTSTMTREGDRVMLHRSRAFLWILLGLAALRIALRSYVETYVSPIQTGALFYLVALGMIVPWRAAMYRRFRQLEAPRAAVAAVG